MVKSESPNNKAVNVRTGNGLLFAGWAVMPAFAAMYFIRTPREERLICEEFGDGYREYARRAGRLFPRLTKAAEPAIAPEPTAGPVSNGESSPPAR